MKWFQENPFLAGLVVVTVIGAGALSFLLSQSLGQYQAVNEGYQAAVAKLHGLQNRAPFPNAENLEKVRALTTAYQERLQGLRSQLVKMELPIDATIQPQQFQDNLRQAVNEAISRAEAAGVQLPEDFYLGFNQYQNSPPSEAAAPALARQLRVINNTVTRLIDFKVHSINLVRRSTLPQESGAAPAADRPVVERFPFEIGFTAEQGKFRVAFNSLLDAEQFLIVRSITVQNSNLVGPPVAGTGDNPAAQAPAAPAAGGQAETARELNVVLGRETVTVVARVEMIDFSDPETPK